ncbi:MAG: glycosyltransferase family 39 protein [Anaerolineae bacterium]|nr:glycosyltransferase family 39 protein [Anaerolineae bacterium]
MQWRCLLSRGKPSPNGFGRIRVDALVAGALVVGFAFLIRTLALDPIPASTDEGLNIGIALRELSALPGWLAYTGDNEPLLHRALLGVHLRLGGASLFSARYFSVGWAALSTALIFCLLRRLGANVLASALASLWSISLPLVVWHTREAKTYSLSLALACLSWLSWMHLVRRPSVLGGAWYVLVTAGLLHTHYYTAIVLITEWAWLLLDQRRRQASTKQFVGLAFVQSLSVLPVAVWVLASGYLLTSAVGSSIGFTPRAPGELALEIARGFFASRADNPALEALGTWLGASLLVLGAINGGLRRLGRRLAVYGMLFAVVLALSFAIQVVVPFFHPRFLVFALPHLAALASSAFARFGFTWLTGVALVISSLSISLVGTRVWQTDNLAEVDLRSSVLDARPYLQRGDAFVGGFIWSEGLLAAYAPERAGQLQLHYVQVLNPERTADVALPIAQSHRRIWLQRYKLMPRSADDWLEQWLLSRTGLAAQFDYPAARMSLFVSPFAEMTKATAYHPTEAQVSFGAFGQAIYRPFTATLRSPAVGATLGFMVRWLPPETPAPHARVFVHLVSADGRLVAQNDGDPINGLAPNFTWTPGTVIHDPRAVLIRSPLAPGAHELRLGLYRVADGRRVHTASGEEFVRVGQLEVTP